MADSMVLSFRAPAVVRAALLAEAQAAGRTLNQFLLGIAQREIAEQSAARAGLPSPAQTFAEDSARFRWFCGNAASPDHWPAPDHVLAGMGPEFASIDFRAALFHELYARRPEIAVAAYALSGKQKDASDVLVESAFSELFDSEPEAKFDAPSIDDCTKLLVAESAGWDSLVSVNGNAANHVSSCYAEAERAGVAGRRAHMRRILRGWRERGITWPEITVDRHGCPRLGDNLKIVLVPDAGRRVPTLVSSPRAAEPEPEVHSVSPTPRPGQIGGAAEVARDLALSRQASAKIAGDPK